MECSVCGQSNPPEAQFCANCGAALVTTIEPVLTVPEVAGEYMGFWIRLAAAIIDSLIVSAVSAIVVFPIGAIGGIPGVFVFLLWLYHWLFTGLRGQTLGKMLLGIKVVDARGNKPELGMAALREIPGKIISAIVLFIGFIWIAGDRQKQGWHDKIAGTYVVKVIKA